MLQDHNLLAKEINKLPLKTKEQRQFLKDLIKTEI